MYQKLTIPYRQLFMWFLNFLLIINSYIIIFNENKDKKMSKIFCKNNQPVWNS